MFKFDQMENQFTWWFQINLFISKKPLIFWQTVFAKSVVDLRRFTVDDFAYAVTRSR